MKLVRMTSREGLSQSFTEEMATRMCRIMTAMKSWSWKLPETHEFVDGYVKRKSNKTTGSGKAE